MSCPPGWPHDHSWSSWKVSRQFPTTPGSFKSYSDHSRSSRSSGKASQPFPTTPGPSEVPPDYTLTPGRDSQPLPSYWEGLSITSGPPRRPLDYSRSLPALRKGLLTIPDHSRPFGKTF